MKYRLGIDGGGTKTEAVLVDGSGTVVTQEAGPGCNPSIVGPEEAKRLVAEQLKKMLTPFSEKDADFGIEATLLCMAGSRAFWQEFAGSLTSFGTVLAVDDSLPVLELATGGGPGIVLHAGTGSFVAGRQAAEATAAGGPFGVVHYAGGLGWRFGDAGSGYDIGRRAVALALLELQGWTPSSGLSRLLKEQTGLAEANAVSRFFYNDSASNPKISQLAPGVLALAAQGDLAAQTLVIHSVTELLDLAMLVAAKLFPEVLPANIPAGLSGPILNHPFVVDALNRGSPLRLKPVTTPPIEGVKRLLAKL